MQNPHSISGILFFLYEDDSQNILFPDYVFMYLNLRKLVRYIMSIYSKRICPWRQCKLSFKILLFNSMAKDFLCPLHWFLIDFNVIQNRVQKFVLNPICSKWSCPDGWRWKWKDIAVYGMNSRCQHCTAPLLNGHVVLEIQQRFAWWFG